MNIAVLNQIVKFVKQIRMIGRTVFPVTKDGMFAAAVPLVVSSKPGDGSYSSCGINKQLHYSSCFSRNVDAMLSITSSYNAAVQSGMIDNTSNIYITVPGEFGHLSIGGASEGIAVLLALIGVKMPERVMATGFVDVVGSTAMSRDQLMQLPIKRIDSACAKAKGAKEFSLRLLLPEGNRSDFKDEPVNVCFVSNVSDALSALQNDE